MRVKQTTTKSFVSTKKLAIIQKGPSAYYKLLFKDPAAMFRQLRDEDDWSLSKDPYKPMNYSTDWRAEMKRASEEAQTADQVEQAGAPMQTGTIQTATKAKGAAPNEPKNKRQQKNPGQPQHMKGSSAAALSAKRGLDHSQGDGNPDLRRSTRARTSTTPPTATTARGRAGSDESEGNEAPSLRRSTRARTSTSPPKTMKPTTGAAGGSEFKEIEVPSLRQSTGAQTSTTTPTMDPATEAAGGFSRVRIFVKDPTNSGLESKAPSSHCHSVGDSSASVSAVQATALQALAVPVPAIQAPAVYAPAVPALGKKASSSLSREYTAPQLKWMNDWFRDDYAGSKTYDQGLQWHQQINRDFEKKYSPATTLAEYSLRNKRQEMKTRGHFDGPVKTVEFYEKKKNYPRKVPTKKKESAAQAPVPQGASGSVNASMDSQQGQSVQAAAESSTKKRKHDAGTVEGSEEVADNEKVVSTSS